MTGRTISHYEVLEKLGEGGMGVVYKARDSHLKRFVALKVLPPEKVADPERKHRFVQEARSASALNHPNIVTVHDIDQWDGIDFIAMEYIEGKALDELIGRKGLKLSEALKYGVQIADALAKAHAAGIVHRDLKPGNVMVTSDGRAKVLDFGLAKLTEAAPASPEDPSLTEQPSTETGLIVGTVSYMSPEQAEGKKVDARSDIFSFGSLLYEMLTGRRAFRRDSPALTLAAILHLEPPPLPAGIPSELERVIARCLRKDVDRRIQHIDDVKLALEELKEDSDSGKLAAAAQASRPAFRWGWTAALAAVTVVLAAAGWLWFSRSKPTAPEAPLTAVPLTSFSGRETSPTFSPDGNQVAFCWNGEKEDNFDIYVQLIGSGRPLRLTTHPAFDGSPAWSPDGKQIAFLRDLGSSRNAVILMPPLGGPERRLAELRSGVGTSPGDVTLAWHPGGKQLAIVEADAVLLLSIETGEKRRLTTPPQLRAHSYPAFSPDGRSLAFIQESNYLGELHVLSLDDGLAPLGEPTRLTTGMDNAACPVWTADGREIIFSAGSWFTPSLWRIAVSGRGKPQRLASVGEGGAYPALTRDGRRLAYSRVAADFNIWRIEVSGRQTSPPRRTRLIASSGFDFNPEFSPDGSKIAFYSNRSGAPEIWVCDRDGSNPFQVTSFGGPLTGTPRWSPDGQQIIFDSRPEGHADIFVVGASGGKPRRLTTNPAQDMMPCWSRDGKWIYFYSNRTGRFEVWKMPVVGTSAPEEPIQMTRNNGQAPYESPDGKLVYYFRSGGVWQVPTEGGKEIQVLESVRNFTSFAVADKGIYFVSPNEAAVRFLDFSTRAIRTVATLEKPVVQLAVSPDGRTILYSQEDNIGSDLMLVENFR